MDKPLQKKAPQKGHLKNITPWAYFRNFMVLDADRIKSIIWLFPFPPT